MGTTIFLLLINDLPDALQSQVALYADDCTIFSSSLGRRDASRTELCSMLDMDLAQVLAWGQDWIVTFNDLKTKLISVSRSKDRNFPSVSKVELSVSSCHEGRVVSWLEFFVG